MKIETIRLSKASFRIRTTYFKITFTLNEFKYCLKCDNFFSHAGDKFSQHLERLPSWRSFDYRKPENRAKTSTCEYYDKYWKENVKSFLECIHGDFMLFDELLSIPEYAERLQYLKDNFGYEDLKSLIDTYNALEKSYALCKQSGVDWYNLNFEDELNIQFVSIE
jgi:hypothetical protein